MSPVLWLAQSLAGLHCSIVLYSLRQLLSQPLSPSCCFPSSCPQRLRGAVGCVVLAQAQNGWQLQLWGLCSYSQHAGTWRSLAVASGDREIGSYIPSNSSCPLLLGHPRALLSGQRVLCFTGRCPGWLEALGCDRIPRRCPWTPGEHRVNQCYTQFGFALLSAGPELGCSQTKQCVC